MRLEDIGPRYQASESITVAGTSIGLTAGTIASRSFAFITLENAAVRFWLDGTAPTATVGHLLEPGDILRLNSNEQLVNTRFIRQGGVSGTLRCSYGS